MPGRFLIQGHRGARGLRPENTLPSFEAALDTGATALELDLQATKEDWLVVFHDDCISESVCRLNPAAPGGIPPPESRPRIRDLRFDELRWYIADRNPDPLRFPDQRPEITPLIAWRNDVLHPYQIPRLIDVIDFVNGYVDEIGERFGKSDEQRSRASALIFDVELKTVPFLQSDWRDGGETLVQEVIDTIRWVGGGKCFRSFDHRFVRRARELNPSINGAVLIEGTARVDPVALVRAADAQVYAPNYLFLDEEQVRQCHDAGVRVLPWTVNDPADWERLLAWGVDGITTDYPDRLAAWINQPPASAR